MFISYVILLTWLEEESFREKAFSEAAYGRSPLLGVVGAASVDRLPSAIEGRQRVESEFSPYPAERSLSVEDGCRGKNSASEIGS